VHWICQATIRPWPKTHREKVCGRDRVCSRASVNQPQFKKLPREFQERPAYFDDLSTRPKFVPVSSLAQQHSALASRVRLVDRSSLTEPRVAGKGSVDIL
jgi:hypothetical protein